MFFALPKLKITAISMDVPGGYAVKYPDETYSVNVLVIPVDSRNPAVLDQI
jgi:hypothetical protein